MINLSFGGDRKVTGEQRDICRSAAHVETDDLVFTQLSAEITHGRQATGWTGQQ